MSNYLDQIDAALDRDDTAAAAALAESALGAGHKEAILYNLTAWQHEEQGQFDEAERLMREALLLYADDPTLHLGLGVVLRKQGKLKAAVDAFEQAIERDPGYASAWFERGATFERGGAIGDASADFTHALRLEPRNPVFMAALASTRAREGALDEAKDLANAATEIAPGIPAASRALAQVAIEERRFEDALELLGSGAVGPDDAESGHLYLLGETYEGLGRFDEAFDAFYRSKQAYFALNTDRLGGLEPEDLLKRLEASGARFAEADKTPWRDAPTSRSTACATHVFLTGHPRSGTTLAENILASLPNATAIEERPTIAGVGREMLLEPGGFERLAKLSEEEIDFKRADYWERATRAAQSPLDGRLFIDMDPFKGTRLPIIARLFPDAKYVLTKRDPRDVVWSCFHTNFAYNSGTATFGTLENTARHYAATWQIIEETLASLDLDWFDLRYESLVRDFDTTIKALCEFLGVEWSEDVRRFDRTAQRRGVSTASITQVRQGLYDGSGGWRRYERQLAEVEPILGPWIDRFGYR